MTGTGDSSAPDEGNEKGERSGAPAKKAKPPFKRQRELDHALDFIRNSHFGVVGNKIRPFSKQMKDEAGRLFPVDADIYSNASRLQRKTNSRYFTLRVMTLGLFCIFTLWTFIVIASQCEKTPVFQSWIPSLIGRPSAIWFVVLGGSVLATIRVIVREIYFAVLKHMVENLSFHVKLRYTNTINDCRMVANEIGNIAGEGDWAERARKSMIVALWHAIRADYLDRYSTTVLWKTDVFFRHAEWGFWVAKIAIMAILALILMHYYSGSAISAHWPEFCLYVVIGFVAWFWLDRKPNGIVEIQFKHVTDSSQPADESASGPYFFALADEIENLVKLAQSGFFNSPGARGQ